MVTAAAITDRRSAQPGYLALFGLTAVAGVLGVIGVIVALQTFTTGGHAAAPDHQDRAAGSEVGAVIDTSFGTLVVENIETLSGLTDEELGGMSHGIASFVATDQAQVSLAILIVNTSDHPVPVGPGDYAIFVDGSSEPIAPASSTIQPLTLQPGSSVDSTVTFIVPRAGAEIAMGYADPDGSVVLVPVGRLDQAPPDSPADHHTTASDDGH